MPMPRVNPRPEPQARAMYYPPRALPSPMSNDFMDWEEREDTQPEERREYRFRAFAIDAPVIRLRCTKTEALAAFTKLLEFYELGNPQGNDLCLVAWDPESGYIVNAWA